jgi:hypothetical protein
MFVRLSFLYLSSILLLSCSLQKPSASICASYKNGEFIQKEYNSSGLGHWSEMTFFINRADSLQTYTRTIPFADTSLYKISWSSACEYNLTLLNPKSSYDSAYLYKYYPKGKRFKITKATADYYIEKSISGKDTIWVKH